MAKSFAEKLQQKGTNSRINISNSSSEQNKNTALKTNTDIIPEKQASKKNETKSSTKKVTVKKSKKGRPCIDIEKGKKRNYCKTINIAVPKEDIDKIQMYALNARGVNLTEYINILIEQDLKKNLTKYKKEINRDKNFD